MSDEHENLPSFFSLFRPSAEAIAEAKDGIERKRALGDLEYPTLPLFAVTSACRKCGLEHEPKMAYCRGDETMGSTFCIERAGSHEHMHRMCTRCDYAWIERLATSTDA